MKIEERLINHITGALKEMGVSNAIVSLERPAELSHGDFATNVAMTSAREAKKNPRALSDELVTKLNLLSDPDILAIEIAGPGFINFKLSKKYFTHALLDAQNEQDFGTNNSLDGKKVIVEYTDPNPFKEFHIGHLMSNTIGESMSRLIEASGAETMRACYQGDVGLHVAKAVWELMKNNPVGSEAIVWDTTVALGRAYKDGDFAYRNDEKAKLGIIEVNKKIYDIPDPEPSIDDGYSRFSPEGWYKHGRTLSLEYFETIYKRLGTNHGDGKAFNFYFFESKTGVFGKEVVLNHTEIFEKSDGAIVYKGDESKGLHTRVFINKEGLPTYEAKELGLAKIKFEKFAYDTSIVITGNEVNDYFAVLLDAMSKVFPDLAEKTEHIGHGMLRLTTGKMSSRTGDVITAVSLIEETKTNTREKITSDKLSDDEKEEIAEQVAIGAIKYSILRQASGKDIIFDVEQSLSFEGDSGPYLQYTHARTCSLLKKAQEKRIDPLAMEGHEVPTLHKLLLRFPEVSLRAQEERAPHFVATYLVELAREFNSFYGNTTVLDGSADEPYKLALVQMTSRVLSKGLYLLGIPAPEKM